MRIFLIGFMGSGKSYVGSRLATNLGLDFLDLDDRIVETAEKSIPEIFEEDGEAAFRYLELGCLKSLGETEDLLVACGGGTPCFFDNMEWMNQHGLTVFLDTKVDLLLKRLEPELAQRPLLADKTTGELRLFLEEKLEERLPFYQEASVIYTQETGAEAIVEELTQRLKPQKPD